MIDFFPLFISPATSSLWEAPRTLLGGELDFSAARDLLFVLGGIAGALILVMAFLRLLPRKTLPPPDWLVEPEQIREILGDALAQRSKFELQFTHGEASRRPALRCSAHEMDSGSITLEATGLSSLSRHWIGRETCCFFSIRNRELFRFFAFTSTVTGIFTRDNICYVTIAMPEKIETRQKRSYLRIAPPEECMLGAALWRGKDSPEKEDLTDLANWPAPSLMCLPGTREDFTVRDLSSGGVRLHLPRHVLAEERDLIHISTRFVLMLDLWDADKAQRLRLWAHCRMQSPVLDFETKGMDIGAQFLSWAKPAENTGGLIWFKLAPSGEIVPLGNWIMRRHLEYFREREHNDAFAAHEAAKEKMRKEKIAEGSEN